MSTALPIPEPCLEKASFQEDYDQAIRAYSEAATQLRANMGVLSRQEYERAYLRTEELRKTTLLAKEQLECHVRWHGC